MAKKEAVKTPPENIDPRIWWAAASVANTENAGGDGASSVSSVMSPASLWKTPPTTSCAASCQGQSTAMAELANLVNAHPRAGTEVHDMRPFLR